MKTLALIAATTALALAGPALADEVRLSAHLGGAGSPDTDGAGHTNFRIDAATNQICYDLMVEKIAPATMAHIHKGAAGASGPVVVPLATPDASGKSTGCATAGQPVVAEILGNPGGYYVNVHNAEHPGGAIRGQLSK
ncbi:MAG: CHRD domain-containing protein [Phenylobacterium sp.]|nr:CHRD domain-containing protein [Phenylobacterium sp.]